MAMTFDTILVVILALFFVQGADKVQTTRDLYETRSYKGIEQCPLSCRCSRIDPRHDLHRRLHSLRSSSSDRFLENAIGDDNAFSRRTGGSESLRRRSGREMECMGLRSLPAFIPSDVIRLSVLGERKEPPDGSVLYEDSQRPSSIKAREISSTSSTNQLSKINKHSFRQSRDLIELSIIGNNIDEIPPGEFEYLPNLIYLNLGNNNLTSINEHSFRGLHQLEELHLSENHFRYLPTNVFADIRELKELHLEKNSLQALQLHSLGSLTMLETLDLSSNQLTYLSKSVFARNRRLRELNLDDNRLGSVRSQWFVRHNSDSHQLETLSANRNKISRLLLGSFQSFTALTVLSLAGNEISSIHPKSFSTLNNMRVLDLRENKLQSISPGTFLKTNKLTELRLADNQLKRIANGTFGESSLLQVLDLSGNKLDEISRENFQNLKSLKKLDLSNNGIVILRNGTFFGLRSLRELNLANNKIGEIEDFSFSVSLSRYTSQITWLNLEHNQQRSISSDTFRSVPHLKFLNLAYNRIRFVDQQFLRSQRQLITLLLNNNDISQLPGGLFTAMKTLRNLNLAGNRVENLTSSSLKGLVALDELNIQGNQLTSLTRGMLQEMPSLQRANFSGNFMKGFDMSNIGVILFLTHLDLSGNGLTDLKVRKGARIGLKYLSLAHNKLNTLNSDIGNFMSPNGILGLRNNRWLCNCELSWMRYLVPIWQFQLENANDLVCSQPLPLANRRILSLRQTEFRCGVNNVHLYHRDTSGSAANRPPVWEKRNLPAPAPRWTKSPISIPRWTKSPRSDPRWTESPTSPPRWTKSPISAPRWTESPRSAPRWTESPTSAPRWTKSPTSAPRWTKSPALAMRHYGNRYQLTTTPRYLFPIERFTKRPLLTNIPPSNIDGFTRRPPSKIARFTRRPPSSTEKFTRQPSFIERFTRRPPSSRRNINYNVIQRATSTPILLARPPTTWKPTTINERAKYDRRFRHRDSRISLVGKVRAIPPKPNLISKATVQPTTASSSTSINPYRRRFWWNTTKAPPNFEKLFRKGQIRKKYPRTNRHERLEPKSTVLTTSGRSHNDKATTTSPLWINFPTFRPVDPNIDLPTTPSTSTTRNPFYQWRPQTIRPVRRIPTINTPTTKRPNRSRSPTKNSVEIPRPDVSNTDVTPRTTWNPVFPRISTATQRYSRQNTGRPITRQGSENYKKYPDITSRPGTKRPYRLTLPPPFPRKPLYTTTTSVPQNAPPQPDLIGRRKTRLECPDESQWRLDFDTKLIRKHKSEVKNYHVTIMNSRRRPACNGVLLSDWWVLTTASCVEKNLASRGKLMDRLWKPKYHVKIGFRELNQVIKVVVHPMFLSRKTEAHDFAMLKLRYESLMTKVVTPPCVMPPERFQSRPAWIVPGVISARLGGKEKRGSLQSMAVKVWEGNCKLNPASCLRLMDKPLIGSSSSTEGSPLYLGYSKTRWGLVGIGTPRGQIAANKFTPTWTILYWLESVVDS